MAEPSREKTGSARELVRRLLRLNIVPETFRGETIVRCCHCHAAIPPGADSIAYCRLENFKPSLYWRFCSTWCGVEYETDTAIRARFIGPSEAHREQRIIEPRPKAQPKAAAPTRSPDPPTAASSRISTVARLVAELKAQGFRVERKGDEIILTGPVKLRGPEASTEETRT